MYRPFFHLHRAPFQLVYDPDFLWVGENYTKSFDTLKCGLTRHGRISLLTGNGGSGKSFIVRAFLESLDQSILSAVIPDSKLTVKEFYHLLAHALNFQGRIGSRREFLTFLKEIKSKYDQVLLIVDESQRLSRELIEELGDLITLRFDDIKIRLSIFLVGDQNNLGDLWQRHGQLLKENVLDCYHLAPLSQNETIEYVLHRLDIAGATGEIFCKDTILTVHRYSKGNPALINIICDLALFSGFMEKTTEINATIIQSCIEKFHFPCIQSALLDDKIEIAVPSENKSKKNVLSLVAKHTTLSVPEQNSLHKIPVENKVTQVKVTGLSFVWFVLSMVLALILLDGGYVFYTKNLDGEKVLPVEQTASVRLVSEDEVTLVKPVLEKKNSSFDALGYSPPDENFFGKEQPVSSLETASPGIEIKLATEKHSAGKSETEVLQKKVRVKLPSLLRAVDLPENRIAVQTKPVIVVPLVEKQQRPRVDSPSVRLVYEDEVTLIKPVLEKKNSSFDALGYSPPDENFFGKEQPVSSLETASPGIEIKLAPEKHSVGKSETEVFQKKIRVKLPSILRAVDLPENRIAVQTKPVIVVPLVEKQQGLRVDSPLVNDEQQIEAISSLPKNQKVALKRFFEAGGFSTEKFDVQDGEKKNKNPVHIDVISSLKEQKTTQPEPDPEDVIDWLLRKKNIK